MLCMFCQKLKTQSLHNVEMAKTCASIMTMVNGNVQIKSMHHELDVGFVKGDVYILERAKSQLLIDYSASDVTFGHQT